MAKLTSDALPSGAIEGIRTAVFGNRSTAGPPLRIVARDIPGYTSIPPTLQMGSHASPYHYAPSQPASSAQHQNGSVVSPHSLTSTQSQNGPISPPVSRTASSEEYRALLIEDWRLYTRNLREQARGERAHFIADRDRMDEVMAEERILWDKEREELNNTIGLLKLEIEALKVDLERRNSQHGVADASKIPTSGQSSQTGTQHHPFQPTSAASSQSGGSNATSKLVPQESGRNPDGSRFYAPAPQNPTRTFDEPQNNDLRVDNMSAPRETPLRVTSKELTQSDFGTQSPLPESSREGSVSEIIDISHIQPDLEGVPIKARAVSPAFAAKVLSPSKVSSVATLLCKGDNVKNNGLQRNGSQEKKSTLDVIAEPENRRLTLNAGHTPNHSVTAFDLGKSGNATPTQDQQHIHHTSMVSEEVQQFDGNLDADPELRGPLGLRNDPPKDALFLAALTNKLNEVKDSGLLSLSEASISSGGPSNSLASKASKASIENRALGSVAEDGSDDKSEKFDDGPRLRMKPSINFGRPFGSL